MVVLLVEFLAPQRQLPRRLLRLAQKRLAQAFAGPAKLWELLRHEMRPQTQLRKRRKS